MKIILSRKGMDSESGGIASAIVHRKKLCWFPIPSGCSSRKYSELKINGVVVGDLIRDLKGKRSIESTCHLDPDLEWKWVPRKKGWRACFGQVGGAQTHLEENGVGVGDLFLFYGWFRRVVKESKRWVYEKSSPDLHMIFGWLQVGAVIRIDKGEPVIVEGLKDHPHWLNRSRKGYVRNNTLYIASDRLCIRGLRRRLPGAGIFEKYDEKRCLTKEGQPHRSIWSLPSWFFPSDNKPPLTFHPNRPISKSPWKREGKNTILATVARGQEFVLDCKYYAKAMRWLQGLFRQVRCT